MLTPLPGLPGRGSQADLRGTCRPQGRPNGKGLPDRKWVEGAPSGEPGPGLLCGSRRSVSGVLPGQVCAIFPAPCWARAAFSSVLSARSDSAQLPAELHVPDSAPGAPTVTISFKEPSKPAGAYDSFHPAVLRLTLRGVRPLAQGHTASSGTAGKCTPILQFQCKCSGTVLPPWNTPWTFAGTFHV